jgi:hypothetical protein
MTQLVKPILSSSQGVYIEEGKLYYNGTQLLDACDSKLIDIINFEKYPINIKILNKILKAYGFNDLINSLVIRDYPKKKLFSIGMGYSIKRSIITHDSESVTFDEMPITFTDNQILDDSYLIAVGDQVKVLQGNGNKFTELKSLFENKLLELDSVFSRIDTVYNRIVGVQGTTDLPIQLLPKGHISDYVSFENNVSEYTNITFDNVPIIGPSTSGDNSPYLRFKVDRGNSVGININTNDGIDVPEFESIVNVGDILDIVIGYKQVEEDIEYITYEDIPIILESDEEENFVWDNSMFEDDELFSFITFDNLPVTVNRYETTYGDYPLFYFSSLLQVKESSMKLGAKFLVEINEDRLVVYSITPYITEYFIKSCRLIKRKI